MEGDPHQSSVDRQPEHSEPSLTTSLELCVESPESEGREELRYKEGEEEQDEEGGEEEPKEESPESEGREELRYKEGEEEQDEEGGEEEPKEEVPEEERQLQDEGQDGETAQEENKQNENDDGDEVDEKLVKESEKEEEELEKGECAHSSYSPEDESSEAQQNRSTVPELDRGDERATGDSSPNSRPQGISDESSYQQDQMQNEELQDRMLSPQELRGSPYRYGPPHQGPPAHFPPGHFHPSSSPFNHPPSSLQFPHPFYQAPDYNQPSPSLYNQQPGLYQGSYQHGWPGHTGVPAFPASQPSSCATPPGAVRVIRPSSNSGSAFSSPTGKDEDESGPKSIKVRGFDSKMDEEALENYFGSKRKSGGGGVDEVEIKKKFAIITFERAAIARRVVSKTGHTIEGKPVTVELYEPGVKKQSPAIKVTGLSPDMDDEMVEAFFESKRKSKGGEVANVERRKGGRVAIITFKEMEVATRVASKSSHQIKDNPVTVELFDSDDDVPEQDPVIKVTGLPLDMKDDQVESYFESKRKSGGGEVVAMERMKGGRIAIVTFKELEVAQRVVSKRNHNIKDHPITVEFYDPDDDTPVQAPVIKVTGLLPNLEDDRVKTFFESKRKCGGGEVVTMERRKGGGIAIITFKEMEDAKRVVEKGQHSIKNTKVAVCFWEEEEEEEGGESSGADIEVRGFKQSTTDEVIQMYFENKSKSGGGTVKSLKRNKKGVITITFDSPTVVERVVSKRDHTLEGKKLTVTAKKTSHSDSASGDDSGSEEFQSAEEGDEKETSTVKVTGNLDETSEDTFALYFENERRSGGGDLIDCSFSSKERALLVTFQSPKVAQRVAEKKDHRLGDRELTVRLHIPPPRYKNRVLFEGVSESVSPYALKLFLENITNQEHFKVLYGDEPGTVLVASPCDLDFEAIRDKCQKKQLDGQHVTPQQVEISRCILVKPVTAEITKDTLELHFDNKKRSGGEGVEVVELMPDMEMAIVKFEDHKVAEQVAKRSHEVSKTVLEVSLHHECLGLSGGTEDPTYFKFPEPLKMEELDPVKTGYLQRLEKVTADLQTTLSAMEACLEPQALQRGYLVVECSVPRDAKDGRRRTRNWTQKAHKAVEDFMQTLAVIQLDVSHDIQEDVTVGMTAMLQEYPCFTLVELNAKQAVVGPHAEMASIRERISAITKEVQESHDRKKNLKEDTVSVQTALKMDLLSMVGLPESVQEKHPKLEVSFKRDNKQVLLKGIDAEILAAKLAIMELLEAMSSFVMSEFSHQQVVLMGEKKASGIVNTCLRQEGLRASWEEKEGKLHVLVLTSTDRDPVQNVLKKTVLEVNIKLDDEQKVLVKSPDWTKAMQTLNRNFSGMWIIGYDNEKGILIVAAIHEVFPEVKQQVEYFLEENAEYTTPLHAPGPKLKFLSQHNREKIERIKREYKVEIQFQGKDSVQIKGKKGTKSQAQEDVSKALCSIQVQTRRLKQFQIKKCLTKTQTGQQRVEDLQKSTKCVIDMEASGEVQREMEGEVDEADWESVATCSVPGTGMSIQVMGSTASQTSAGAILVVLGKEEEQELKARVASFPKTRSLKESDVEWLPGAKGDKSLLITKGPESGSFVEPDTTIKDLIKKALETAEKHRVTSVAVPVETLILSGTDFSAMETCRAVVESIQAFVFTHKDQSISSIILCFLKLEIQDLLVESLESKFGRQNVSKTEPDVSEEASELPQVDAAGASLSTGPRIFLEKKDIVREEPDVMVNSTNTSLDLHQGQVSKALLQLGGQALQDECKTKYPEGIKPGEIAVTRRVGNLLCRHAIYHIALEKWNSDTGEKALSDYVGKVLEKAAADKMTSVAFPALGTGNLGYPRDVVARSMYNGVTQFGVDNPQTSVKDVYFVVHPTDKGTVSAFEQEEKNRKGKKPGFISQLKGVLGVGAKPKQAPKTPVPMARNPRSHTTRASRADSSLIVAVYAENQETIDKTFASLMTISKKEIMNIYVQEPSLCKWTEIEMKQLHGLSQHGVDVTVQLHPGQIELHGLNGDIMPAQTELHKIIRKVDEARQEREKAKHLANYIQWYFVEIGEEGERLEKYDDVMVNYAIEMAYKGGKEKYHLPGGDYYIDFSTLMEYSATREEEPVRVVRRDKVKEAQVGVPEEWDQMGKNDLIKPVLLPETSKEYQEVVKNMQRTMGVHSFKIVKIERIQNIELWNQYGAKRLQIERNCKGKEFERMLWHGTNAEAVPSIIMRGFNRSYCGKNATALGQGVYFATNSAYSSRDKYSPAEKSNGHKHMFQAKVLVGVPTPGKEEMRVLGPRDPANPDLLFDSAVDKVDGPEIIVIFNDTQAYPEYHIVFTV